VSQRAEVNEAERRRWNDEHWASVWPAREQLTGAVTGVLLEYFQFAGDERVLDVGSGAGIAALAAAHALSGGSVVGVDISRPLVEFATRRADREAVTNLGFVVADAQCDSVAGGPFDAALSQFGVMFFDDPVAAFANIRRHMRSGGRLAFACWQPIERNPWFVGHAIGEFLPMPASPRPGVAPPGPFSLGDPDRRVAMLDAAGWSDIGRRPYEMAVPVEGNALFDGGQLRLMGVPVDRLEDARSAVDRHMAGLRRPDGLYEASLAFQVFSATA
jgi:SAM-dependent methyltransferase